MTRPIVVFYCATAYIARYRPILLPVYLSVCPSQSHRWITLKRLVSGRAYPIGGPVLTAHDS